MVHRDIEVSTAALWRRGLSGIVDGALLGSAWVGILIASARLWNLSLPSSPWRGLDRAVDLFNRRPEMVLSAALVLFGLALVLSVSTGLVLGRSPGQRLAGLRLLNKEGKPPGSIRVLVYATIRIPCLCLLGLGLFWALIDPQRRTLYDRIVGVYVTVVDRGSV